jgi:hypothetical protein
VKNFKSFELNACKLVTLHIIVGTLKKKVGEFPVPRRDVNYHFPAQGSLVSDNLARDGKMANLFLQCMNSSNVCSLELFVK